MDVDNLLRYMAVHIFSANEDSLSGMMAHNYYLYEAGGKAGTSSLDYNSPSAAWGAAMTLSALERCHRQRVLRHDLL